MGLVPDAPSNSSHRSSMSQIFTATRFHDKNAFDSFGPHKPARMNSLTNTQPKTYFIRPFFAGESISPQCQITITLGAVLFVPTPTPPGK